MYYSSKTPKIGTLLLAFESAEKNATTETLKNEIKEAFNSTMSYLIPFKLVGIHEEDGTAKLGIFQTSTDRDKWLKAAQRKRLRTEKGNGYNLQPNSQNRFDIDYKAIAKREISEDLSSIIFYISR